MDSARVNVLKRLGPASHGNGVNLLKRTGAVAGNCCWNLDIYARSWLRNHLKGPDNAMIEWSELRKAVHRSIEAGGKKRRTREAPRGHRGRIAVRPVQGRLILADRHSAMNPNRRLTFLADIMIAKVLKLVGPIRKSPDPVTEKPFRVVHCVFKSVPDYLLAISLH